MKPMLEQMPGLLKKFDDPYGITWRLANAIKRFSLTRTLRFIKGYTRPLSYERPVFIIGVPRSGTTMLFHLLRESSQLAALPREGHDLWRTYHHPRNTGWRSDVVNQGEVGWGEPRFVKAFFYSYFGEQRFVEKTPENCLRIPYLLELFPDAIFVVIKRNPCDVINSLINGWRHPQGRFRSYFVPETLNIPDYHRPHQWCFALIDGWRDYIASPIPEIAFAQWQQCTQKIAQGRTLVAPTQWIEICFEDLLSYPQETMTKIYQGIEIENERVLEAKLSELLANPVNALTPPGKDKWREQNLQQIKALLPKIAALAVKADYTIDPQTGKFEI